MNPEDVARFPLPGTASPISLSFSPDDNILSYLHAEGGQLTRQVCVSVRVMPLSIILLLGEYVAPLGCCPISRFFLFLRARKFSPLKIE